MSDSGAEAAPAQAIAGGDVDLAALGAWMRAHVPGATGEPVLTRFTGGQSNPTYRVDCGARSWVLRRQPFGALLPSAHAVDREYRVLAALRPAGFPVPEAVALCEDASVIGAKFLVMGLAEGRILWDGALPGMTPARRRAHYLAMIDTLAALHRIDPVAAGLSDHGRPGNYCERQIARWTQQYRASETRPIPAMDRLADWLPAHVPPQIADCVVHGDYRIDNLVFGAAEDRVVAVLDWELSTLGDPVADLSYFLLNWITPHDGRAGLLGLDLDGLGIPTAEEMTMRYRAMSGFHDLPPLAFHHAFNLFRFAAILQGIAKRVDDGTASAPDAREMAARVAPIAAAGWDWARIAGAKG